MDPKLPQVVRVHESTVQKAAAGEVELPRRRRLRTHGKRTVSWSTRVHPEIMAYVNDHIGHYEMRIVSAHDVWLVNPGQEIPRGMDDV